jgi:uncharacterized protein YndB with AHSA1/START domain
VGELRPTPDDSPTLADRSIDIARPPERVFEWIADPRAMLAWQPMPIELVDAPTSLAAGARFVMRVRAAGRAWDSPTEVLALEAPRLLAMRSRAAHLWLTTEWRLSPTDAGTRVQVRTSREPPRGIERAMQVFYGSKMRAFCDSSARQQLDALRRYAESR